MQGKDEGFTVMITSDSHVMTQNLTLTPGEWNHAWIDLTGFANQTVTITFGFQDQSTPQQLYLDEISVGDTQPGVYPTYLPLIRR